MSDYDLIVIGGGSGGLSAARASVRSGARTLLIQKGELGGDCTFTGCVPSKALIEAAARREGFDTAMAQVRRAVRTVAADEDDAALGREGVEVAHGWAEFRSPTEISLDGRRLRSARFVIATGAGPAVPPIEGLADVEPLTNENVFELDRLPGSLAVLGGGAIGCELAQAFALLGSHVTVTEAMSRLLPNEEPETSETVLAALTADGVTVRIGSKVTRAEALDGGRRARLHLQQGETVVSDRVLVALGRRAAIRDIGLDNAGVQTERGFVKTDRLLATTAKGIWAVGDVAGKLQFTHAADEMGRIAVANALSRLPRRQFHPSRVPWVTFTSPEVGRIGITEAEAVGQGARVAFLPMTEVDRAIAAGETLGFIKLIAGPRAVLGNAGGGRLLGATVVASRGGELIHEAALAMRTRMFVGRLAQTTHAYPTWSAGLQRAAAQFFFNFRGREARPAGSPHPSQAQALARGS